MLHSRQVLLLMGFAVATACGGGNGGGGGPGPTPTQMTPVAGDNQVGPAGQPLGTQLQVLVRDAASTPLRDISVTWAAATGGGSVSPTPSTSDVNGIASTTRTLGPNAGTQTTRASLTGLTPVTFTAVAQIQGATQIAALSGAPQTDTVLATLPDSLVVRARDHNNANVQGVSVTWTAPGNGKVNGAATTTTTTGANGEAWVTYQLGSTAGQQTPTAAVTGLSGSPVGFALVATAGNANVLAKTGGDGGSAVVTSQVTYTVTARDAHNNVKAGVTIDWAVPTDGGGGTINPAQNTTGATGTASAIRTLSGTVGPHTATATAAVIAATDTFTTTATSAPLAAGVTLQYVAFNPASVTIAVNGRVTWTWADGPTEHNVMFDTPGSPADIPTRVSGSVFRDFLTAGTYDYHCGIHGAAAMSGSVTVAP